jgi:hypothetical protein
MAGPDQADRARNDASDKNDWLQLATTAIEALTIEHLPSEADAHRPAQVPARAGAVTTNVINVIFKSGERQPIVCLNAIEAQSIYIEILQAMAEGLPLIAVEDDGTAVAINVVEIAAVALGEQMLARIEQAPQPRPRPQPVPARVERGVTIAN